ncbi:MAG: glycoside hydrolase family 15 protein [Bacteroidota bacterium]
MHKYNFGIIGNCSYLAYIDTNANVIWACLPRFDSSFIFGSLLDQEKGGEFSVRPAVDGFSSKQYYLENTNVLCTEFTCSEGSFRVTDFAPRFRNHDRNFKPQMLVRKVEPLQGRPSVKVKCTPVGNYGGIQPEIVSGSNHIRYFLKDSQARLTTNLPLSVVHNSSSFVLSETAYLFFSYGIPLEGPLEETSETFLKKTIQYWRDWIKTTSIPTIYQKEIIRSALVLKLHQYEDTGGIIASGSTSLPEHDQSGRTWDYRYCWMRDAFYTLKALNSLGHFEELEKYFHYIENIIHNRTSSHIQPLYSITGESKLVEKELPLAGYLGNQPVRIGNDAYTHIQNDVYGQVLVSLQPLYTDQRLVAKMRSKSLELIHFLLDRIAETMDEPDAGLWEFRNKSQLHSYTFLFHWAGSKAAGKIGRELNDAAMEAKALQLETQAAAQLEKCFDHRTGAYTQAIGSPHMDASTLQFITMNYLTTNNPRSHTHFNHLVNQLMADNGLLYRYTHADDFGKPESAFLVCSFWYAEALACLGKVDDAIATMDRLLKYTNHLGIFSEDVDMKGGQWGNYPQTYSHVGLMNTAFRIARKLDVPMFF